MHLERERIKKSWKKLAKSKNLFLNFQKFGKFEEEKNFSRNHAFLLFFRLSLYSFKNTWWQIIKQLIRNSNFVLTKQRFTSVNWGFPFWRFLLWRFLLGSLSCFECGWKYVSILNESATRLESWTILKLLFFLCSFKYNTKICWWTSKMIRFK